MDGAMKRKKITHKCRLLIETIKQGRTTAAQFTGMSHPNQYYNKLRDVEIIRDEWGYYGDSIVKWRYIDDMNKALGFLQAHGVSIDDEIAKAS